ncbi:hypothetical protein BpHYR1_054425 [Brachionus plicatilis]|uniref:Uncharacterized protein n=1 Tax=Brachionus plicatilis TaxID=10195 RepID=A0A3M7SET0_BRAPC|nr:hypothetical protein BpHYR1_054425 [Brachionus plicatilis]
MSNFQIPLNTYFLDFLGVIEGGDSKFKVNFGNKAVTWAWHSIFWFDSEFLGDFERLGRYKPVNR